MSINTSIGPHSTYRAKYLINAVREELKKLDDAQKKYADNLGWFLSNYAYDMAVQSLRLSIVNQYEYQHSCVEYADPDGAESKVAKEQADALFLRWVIKEMFRMALTTPVHSSTSSVDNLIAEAKINFARLTLDRLGIDAYRINEALLDTIMSTIVTPDINLKK